VLRQRRRAQRADKQFQRKALRAGVERHPARGEQRVDQLLLLPSEPQDFVAGGAEGVNAGLRVAQQAPGPGDRCALRPPGA
jgi:hypothetical protein